MAFVIEAVGVKMVIIKLYYVRSYRKHLLKYAENESGYIKRNRNKKETDT